MLLFLCGCLPEDRIRALRFSPNGLRIAYITDKKGLCVAELKVASSNPLVRRNVVGDALVWSTSGHEIAYTTNASGSWDISVSGLDGTTTHITESRARESDPFYLADGSLGYLSSAAGADRILFASPTLTTDTATVPRHDIIQPTASPTGTLAYYSVDALRLQLYSYSPATQLHKKLTDVADPLEFEGERLQFNASGNRLLIPFTDRAALQSVKESEKLSKSGAESVAILHLSKDMQVLTSSTLADAESIRQPIAMPTGSGIAYLSKDKLKTITWTGNKHQAVKLEGLAASLLEVSGKGETAKAALVVQEQLIALTDLKKQIKVLTFDLQDQFLLAESTTAAEPLQKVTRSTRSFPPASSAPRIPFLPSSFARQICIGSVARPKQ